MLEYIKNSGELQFERKKISQKHKHVDISKLHQRKLCSPNT